MPPHLALILTYAAILWLVRKDMLWRRFSSPALFIPFCFLGVIGSRPLSYWIGGGTPDGSPVNTAFFASIIALSILALNRRGFSWVTAAGSNSSLFLIYAFFAITSLWSEQPVLAEKRLIKDFSCVIVAFVLLTDKDPGFALRVVVVRLSYILFPLSMTLGKYFPSIGRNTAVKGDHMFTGVTTQKNSLGLLVFVFTIIIIWDLVKTAKEHPGNRLRIMPQVLMLLLGIWLLITCDSKTSLLCLILGASFFASRHIFGRLSHGKAWLVVVLMLTGTVAVFDRQLGISQFILEALDRDSTFTGRTNIWQLILQQNTDPLIGQGFYLFWDSDAGRLVSDTLITVNSAHNGYIEVYIDGGIIGCVLLGIFLLVWGRRSIQAHFQNLPYSPVALSIWITAIVYNYSESSFFRLEPLWFMLILVALIPPPTINSPSFSTRSRSSANLPSLVNAP